MKFVRESYYEILKVSPEATNEEVKRAYRVVRRSYRSDSMAVHSLYSAEETEAIASKIDEAFRLLSSPESSARYSKYHRSGRAGMAIPRDPDAFFEQVHQLDGPSAIEELARQMAGRPAPTPAAQPTPPTPPGPRGEVRSEPVEVRRRGPKPGEQALRLTSTAPKVAPALLEPPTPSLDPEELSTTGSTRQRAPLAPRPSTLIAVPAVGGPTTRSDLPALADSSLDDTALDDAAAPVAPPVAPPAPAMADPAPRVHAPVAASAPRTQTPVAAPAPRVHAPVAAPTPPPAPVASRPVITGPVPPTRPAAETPTKPARKATSGSRLGRGAASLFEDVAPPLEPAPGRRLGGRASSLLEQAVASLRDEPGEHDPVEALLGVPTPPPPAPPRPRAAEAKVEMLLEELEEIDETEFDDVSPGLASLVPEPRALVESLPHNTPAPSLTAAPPTPLAPTLPAGDWGEGLPAASAATVASGWRPPSLSPTKAAGPAVGLLKPLAGWDLGPGEAVSQPAALTPSAPVEPPAARTAPPAPPARQPVRAATPAPPPRVAATPRPVPAVRQPAAPRPAPRPAPPAGNPFAPPTFRPAPMPSARPATTRHAAPAAPRQAPRPAPPAAPPAPAYRPAATFQPAPPSDPSLRPLPGARVGPEYGSSTTLASVAAVQHEPEHRSRRWVRETVRTRAVGALDVQPLPFDELEAIQMDCGGVNGEYLKQVRRQLGIGLEDIANRTKIGLSWLRAIEADDLEEMPARVYLKGYLSQMCRLLRLPVPQTPERYLANHRSR